MSPQRTLWSDLRAIDQAVVPRVAALVGHVRTTLAAADDRFVRALRALDNRFARYGLLGLVRDVPQVGAVGLALLLSIAAITTGVRIGGNNKDNTAPDLPAVLPTIATVGPFPNEDVASYLAAAQASLMQAAAQSPSQQLYAIADFEAARTPEEAAVALPGVTPELIFVRVRVTGAKQTFPSESEQFSGYPALKAALTVHNLPGDALADYLSLASALERAATDNTTFANSIGANATADDLAQKAAQLKDARHYRAEAAAFRSGCACVYAVVVRGSARTLLDILDSGKVRVIDPASPGVALREIRWTPLLPETTRRQPAATATGAP